MNVRIAVIHYSATGVVHQLATSLAQGATSAGAEVRLRRVAELAPPEAIAANSKWQAHRDRENAPDGTPLATLDDLAWADGIALGSPTRFGGPAAQLKNFLDQTGGLWAKGGLIGKVGSVFASTATQHGGQETTITSFHNTLLHHGMVIGGVPYSCTGLTKMDEITGGGPYGATTLAGPDGKRQPSANELEIARFQGKHVAEIAKKLAK